jgi:hypothetical protein
MHSLTFTSGLVTNWKALYRAAMQETDQTRLSQRISEAEHAALSRVRELFYTSGNMEEKDELKDALYTLHAFRSASEHLEEAA